MGGTGYIIPVENREDLLEQAFHPRPSFLQKLRGKSPRPASSDDDLIDLPHAGVEPPLLRSFRTFIQQKMTPPWDSTKTIFSYLKLVGPKLYVRADRAKNTNVRRSYIDVCFSGCGGMAEVSAEVAWHWARIWHGDRRQEIQELLGRCGFAPRVPTPDEAELDTLAFLPFGFFGYAKFITDQQHTEWTKMAGPDDPMHRFEVDGSAEETDMSTIDVALAMADEQYASKIRTHGCHCQLCAAHFDPAEVSRACRLH